MVQRVLHNAMQQHVIGLGFRGRSALLQSFVGKTQDRFFECPLLRLKRRQSLCPRGPGSGQSSSPLTIRAPVQSVVPAPCAATL